jgi:hypothetical protein
MAESRIAVALQLKGEGYGDRLEQRQASAHEGPAEIVIFPGVRIERYDFSLADRLPPPRRRGRPTRMQALEFDRGD